MDIILGMNSLLSDIDLAKRLIAFDTTSCESNLQLISWVADYLDTTGAKVDLLSSEDGLKANLVARVGPDCEKGEGLTLSGHVDTVPAEEDDWISPAFELTQRDDALFGRGSCDMKGFCAVAINALRAASQQTLKAPLCVLLTYDEEVGSLGAKQLAQQWKQPLPRATIVGEPTSLRVVRMHKGHLKIRIDVKGIPAHSGSPHLGRNAVEEATRIVASLQDLALQMQQEPMETSQYFSGVPYAVLTIVGIRGGNAMNIVPDKCEIDLSVRLLPGQDKALLLSRINSCIAEAGDGGKIATTEENPTLLTPPEASIYDACCKLVGQTETLGVSYASDGGFLAALGLEAVLFGPGDIGVAHKSNEYVPIDELQDCSGYIKALALQMCGGA
jgi:acetylornithine deacetylase